MRIVPAYKHLGTLVTGNANPSAYAARRVHKATIAYAQFSGLLLSSGQLDVHTQLRSVSAVVDSTFLHGGELWTLLYNDLSSRVEAVHMRWLRKSDWTVSGIR